MLAATGGCDRTADERESVAPSTNVPAPVSPAEASDDEREGSGTPADPGPDADADEWTETTNGLAFTDPTVQADADGLVVTTRRWAYAGRTGTAWQVNTALPLEVDVEVRAADAPVAFESLLPSDARSWAAINGGFYDTDGSPMGVVIADGVVQTPYTGRGGSGVFQVVDGAPAIVHRSAFDESATQAVQSIDRIVDGGQSLVTAAPGARSSIAARSAVVIADGRLSLVALAEDYSIVGEEHDVQLTRTSGFGLPLWAFAEYLVEALGATEALNLDGAVSTHLAASVGGQEFRVRGVRGTPNAVVLRAAR